MKKDYYSLLGVAPNAPLEIITAVYRTWMYALRMHPDLGGDEECAKDINEAYEVLKDPGKRAHYDSSYRKGAEGRADVRRAPRFRVDSQVWILSQGSGRWERAHVLDASALGIKMVTDIDVEIGDHLSIAFGGSASDAAEAYARWVRELESGELECGVEFFRPIPDILKRLS